jgi:hypothetical protein
MHSSSPHECCMPCPSDLDSIILIIFSEEHNSRRMTSSWMLRRVALVTTDVSEELSASFIRVTRMCKIGRTSALTSNRRTLSRLLVRASVLPSLRFLSP